MTRLAKLLGMVGIAALLAGAPAQAQPPATPEPEPEAVAMGRLLVDPATGEELGRLGIPKTFLGVVAVDDVFYASILTDDGSSTEVIAVRVGSAEQAVLDRLPGRAEIMTVAPDGTRLLLLEFSSQPPIPDGPPQPPIGVISLAIPERWRGGTPAGQRDEGLGLLSADGRRRYRVLPTRAEDGTITGSELAFVTFGTDGVTTATMPLQVTYYSILLAPGGRKLYLVDYGKQVVQVIDVERRAVVWAVGFGRVGTKRPSCAAALSPGGSRLYVLGNTGPTNAGDGILVYETDQWQMVGHFLPEVRNLYCLAVAADGRRLYATTLATSDPDEPNAALEPLLITVDARTGDEIRSVPWPSDYFWPVAAA